jgi:hypothetical protein
MISSEAVVLAVAVLLAVVVFMRGRKGTLTPRMGVLLLALAMLAALAAFVHMAVG